MRRTIRAHWPVFGLIVLLLFHLVANILWLSADKTPPAWDQAAHIRGVVLVNQWLTGRFWGKFPDLINALGGYPPLIYFIGGGWSVLAGVGVVNITFLNYLFLALAVVGVYKLARAVGGSQVTAFGAAMFFSFVPVIYDISRNFLLDLALVAWVVWGVYFWVKSNFLEHWNGSFWFGVCLILASLTKLNGFIYFGVLILMALVMMVRNRKWVVMEHLLVLGAIYIVAVGWWWILNFKNIYDYLTGLAGQGEPLTDPTNLWSWRTWLHYYKLFFLHQLSPTATVILTGVIGWWLTKRVEWKKYWYLLLFVAFNYTVFTVIKNKDFRFTMPLLSVVAVVFWLAVDEIKTAWVKKTVIGILGVYLGFYFLTNSFEWPIKKEFKLTVNTFLMGGVDVINVSDYPVRSPKVTVWPNREITSDLSYMVEEGKLLRVLVLINREEVNDNNLTLYREMEGIHSYDFGSVGSRAEFGSEGELIGLLRQFDVFLVPDNSYEPAPFYGINVKAYGQARDYILGHQNQFDLKKTYEVYQGKKLFLFAKNNALGF